MRRLAIVLALAALGAASAGCRKSHVDRPLAWHHDVASASALAKTQNKPLIVFFGADWDTAWKEIQHRTLADQQVRTLLNRDFVSVYVDMTDEDAPGLKDAVQQFKVFGDPTIVILGPDGKSEITRFMSFITPEVFAKALRAATKEDAVREAAFEAAIRQRAEEARSEEAYRKAMLQPPAATFTITIPDAP